MEGDREMTPYGITAIINKQQQQEMQKQSKQKQSNYVDQLTAVAGNDSELQKLLATTATNMDNVAERRRVREAFKDIQHQIDHCLMKIPYEGLKIEESYEVNSRGVEIFCKSWLPAGPPPKALVFYCHGYGETCTFVFEGVARKLALCGYGVFALDYPGFGLSEGLHGYISSLDLLSCDVAEHFSKVRDKSKTEYRGLRCYLFGQSLGGAVALKVHLMQPNDWDGAILVAPMVKFAGNMLPHWLLLKILIGVAHLFPKLKIVPHQNFVKMAFRDPKKRDLAAYNVIAYKDTARLWTALECLRTTQELEHCLHKVSAPLLILHGEADVVTDPSVSKALYEKASSWDKKLRLYSDAYHSLLEGETDEVISEVVGDIISWLDQRHAVNIQQP